MGLLLKLNYFWHWLVENCITLITPSTLQKYPWKDIFLGICLLRDYFDFTTSPTLKTCAACLAGCPLLICAFTGCPKNVPSFYKAISFRDRGTMQWPDSRNEHSSYNLLMSLKMKLWQELSLHKVCFCFVCRYSYSEYCCCSVSLRMQFNLNRTSCMTWNRK